MEAFLQELKRSLGSNDDLFEMQYVFLGQVVTLLGYTTLTDISMTVSSLQQQEHNARGSRVGEEAFWHTIGSVHPLSVRLAVSAVLDGQVVLLIEGRTAMIVVDAVQRELTRAIEAPSNESVLQGPIGSFNEDLDTNLGLLRKQACTDSMRVLNYSAGVAQRKRLSLIYDARHADADMVGKMIAQIEANLDREIATTQTLSRMLGFTKWQAISKFNTTELPQEAVSAMTKGKVVILVDRLPIAYVLPNLLWDMFALENDRNYTVPIMIIIRTIRVIGVLLTLLAPAFYVALVAVNPEVLRIEMALSVAVSREGVPYPAIVEMLLMLVILELIIEASARLPKSIGPTLTMVGGIIIGQAVVTARLVSNMLIIILAATTIANSTVVGFQNSLSIRMFKYVTVILAAMFGVLGIMAGMVLLCSYLASLHTFGVSYINLSFKGEIKHG
ncbi:spore germination protein [Paenibacillus arenilitoris]|uniref:Spore germination protein n=1 Tax=Paenibacillus arenilitoris TaxID=2772299 RepID=A0A927CRQ7_9BACL|nr:spore germination protein [Paenibacillus arenilitoris]MBD2872280.1 spore germination protein [Paenibacillus arenilitoris]